MSSSKIKIGIVRKIRTADFEQLDVSAEIEEEIEWENEAQRKQQYDAVNLHLIDDFTKTYNSVLDTIGVKRAIGSARLEGANGKSNKASVYSDGDNKIDKKSKNSEPVSKEKKSEDDFKWE